jgi:hypothetical protein
MGLGTPNLLCLQATLTSNLTSHVLILIPRERLWVWYELLWRQDLVVCKLSDSFEFIPQH